MRKQSPSRVLAGEYLRDRYRDLAQAPGQENTGVRGRLVSREEASASVECLETVHDLVEGRRERGHTSDPDVDLTGW